MAVESVQAQELKQFLPLKEWGIVTAEGVALGAVALAAHNLGLTETYANLAISMAHGDLLLGFLKDTVEGVWGDPEKLRPALRLAGFTAGVVTDLLYSAGILGYLMTPNKTSEGEIKPKIVLEGTHTYRVNEDTVKVQNLVCVDARQPRSWQDEIEPGAGQMGGASINQNFLGTMIDKFGDGPVSDYFSGYFIGRTLPTAALSGFFTMRRAVKSWSGRTLENQLPHDGGCTWSTTESVLKLWLKFSRSHHETKVAVLDAWNRLDEFTNTLLWEPLMNLPAMVLSGGRYRIPMSFGRVPVKDKN